MRQCGKRHFITVSSGRIQFQMAEVGVDQEPLSEGAHHPKMCSIAAAVEGFFCSKRKKKSLLERAVSIAG